MDLGAIESVKSCAERTFVLHYIRIDPNALKLHCWI